MALKEIKLKIINHENKKLLNNKCKNSNQKSELVIN